jgi:hypothetical protein
MRNIYVGLVWAAAMLLAASAKHYGVVSAEVGVLLLGVIPVIGILSLRPGCSCQVASKAKV